jgi:hypothetical protein
MKVGVGEALGSPDAATEDKMVNREWWTEPHTQGNEVTLRCGQGTGWGEQEQGALYDELTYN